MLIKKKKAFYTTLMKVRFEFLFTDLSQYFGINLVVFGLCTEVFY